VITYFPKENQGVRQTLVNLNILRNAFVTIDRERGTKVFRQVCLVDRMGLEKDSSGADEQTREPCARAVSDQNLIAEVQSRDLSCSYLPRAGRPPLTLGPQVEVEAFLQKYPFASARIIAKDFLTAAYTVKEIPQRELGMRKFSRFWVLHSLSDAQKVARVEVAKNLLRILQESEANDFDGIAEAMSPGFNTPRDPRKCLPVRQQISFRGRGRQLARNKL
jgi:hypothetical protein